MVCPFCLQQSTKVYNSRSSKNGYSTWRRRRCLECGKQFTTTETLDPATVLRVNGLAFSYSTFSLSLAAACSHLTDSKTATTYLAQTVLEKLYKLAAKNKQSITTEQIIANTAAVLAKFDMTAQFKYLSQRSHLDAKKLKNLLKTTS